MPIRSHAERRRDWQIFLEQARGPTLSTIVAKLAALREGEAVAEGRSFRRLWQADVIRFKQHMLTKPSAATGERLCSLTIVHTVDHGRRAPRTVHDFTASFAPSARRLETSRAIP